MLPWLFDLEGIVLDFLSHSTHSDQYLLLEVEQEHITISLPAWFSSRLQPGDRVRCRGRSWLDTQTKTSQLDAYQVLTLPITTW
jgi:hypothetical protein